MDNTWEVIPNQEVVDPVLLKAIQDAPASGDKPSKWNNYETRSPKQVLIDETLATPKATVPDITAEDTSIGSKSKQDQGWEVIPGQSKQEASSAPEWEVIPGQDKQTKDVSSPNLLSAAGQGLVSGLGDVAHTGMVLAGGVAGLASQDAADTVFGAADKLKEAANTAILTSEQQAQETTAQKIVGGIAGAAPVIGMALVSPAAGIGTMVTSSGVQSSVEKLKQGSDLNRALASGAISAGGAALTAFIPGIGTTISRTIGLGAGTNIGQQIGTDLAIRSLYPDMPEIAKQHNPWDWEKLTVSGAVGGALGIGFHYQNKMVKAIGAKQEERANEAGTIWNTEFWRPLTDKLLGIPETRYQPHEGMDASTTIRDLLINGDPAKAVEGAQNGEANLKQFLDLIAQDKSVPMHSKALANVLSRLDSFIGLHNVDVGTNVIKDADGHYSFKNDKGEIKLVTDHKELVQTILHEAVHAVNHGAIDLYLNNKADGGARLTNPKEKELYNKASDLNTIFEMARGKSLEKLGIKTKDLTPEEQHANINSLLKTAQDRLFSPDLESVIQNHHDSKSEFFDRHYGFKDLHEFASEVMTNPEFAKHLSGFGINPDQIALLKTSYPRSIKNLWQATRAAFKQILGLGEGQTLHDVAFDHVSGLTESVNARTRNPIEKQRLFNETQVGLREDFQEKADNVSKGMLRRMANVLSEASTRDELLVRLNGQSQHPEWRNWVASHIDHIWDNAHKIIETAGESDYSKMSKAEQKWVHDDRSLDQFMAEKFNEYVDVGKITKSLTESQDLKGGGRRLFAPNILNIMKDGFAGDMVRYINHRASEMKSMTEIVYQDAIAHFKRFNELPHKEKLALMDTISYYDKVTNRKELTDRGLQWIPDEWITRRGHNEATLNAYHDMAKGTEFLHSLLNQALAKRGQPPIPMLAGYMPHVFPGAFKVLVKLIKPADPLHPEYKNEFVVHVKAFKFRQQADRYVRELNKGKYDDARGQLRPDYDPQYPERGWRVLKHEDISNSLVSAMQEHQTAYKNASTLEPETLQAIEKIDNDTMRGFSKHILERSDVSGYLGEFGQQKGFGSGGYNNKMLTLWQNYAKSVTEYYRNTLFTDEVLSRVTDVAPISIEGKTYYASLFKNTGELNKHLKEFGFNFTGENMNELKWLDNAIQKISIQIGVDPLAYRRLSRDVRNFLSITKLRANPGNYIANTLQPLHALSLLHLANEMMRADGRLDLPDPQGSFAKAMLQRFSPDNDMALAVQWARDHHHLDPQLENELHAKQLSPWLDKLNTATGGKINPAIEGMSRATTYMIAYEHFRQVFKGDPDKARTAAVQLMEMTMVNYDHSSRPLMYQNFGVAGEAISPFAVFRNGYLGNTALMFQMLSRHHPSSVLPLVMQQLIYLTTAGVVGMVGASEVNMIVNSINKYFPEADIPTVEEFLYEHKIPDVFTYGLLSSAPKMIPGFENGTYLGSSLNAVGGDDIFSSAMIPFLQAMGAVVGVVGKNTLALMNDNVTPAHAEDYYKAGKQLVPGIFQGAMDKFYMNGSNVAPKTSSLEGNYEREQADWNSLFVMGRRSIKETHESSVNRIISQNEKANKEAVKNLISILVDYSMGIPNTSMTIETARGRAAQLMGEPNAADQIDKMIMEGRMNRMYPAARKEAELTTGAGARQQDKRRRLMGN